MRVRGKHEYDLPPVINTSDNLAAIHLTTADPTTAADDTAGYYEGYLWIATSSGDTFICEDASTGAAVWTAFSPTTSIVGITGTQAEFDTALTDGNFMYIGDAPTAHTHLLAAGATDVTATAAEVNLLDLAGLTVGWVLSADSGTTASWKAPTGGAGDVATDTIWDAVGDLAVGTGADTAAKLVMGTSLQVLRVNSGATALEWAAPSGGSSRTASSVSTTDATLTLLEAIDTLTNSGMHIIEVFITARETGTNSEWGVWKRTLAVSQFGGTVVVQQVSADMDKQSTGLKPGDVAFAVSGTSVNVNITGIAATNIDWDSKYEIISIS